MSSQNQSTISGVSTDSTTASLSGYVGFANLPNQVHRKSVKKGFEFTLMVVGESGLGKSTLINSLFLSDLYPDKKIADPKEKLHKNVKINAKTVEIEERGVKLRLTVVDTPGFGDAIDNRDSFSSIIKYIDDQFEKYFHGERGLHRRNIADSRVHCCFYFISPFGHGLKPFDIEFMKQLHQKVNIVPIIAKADVLTKKEVVELKTRINREIIANGIKVYSLPEVDEDEDEDYKEEVRQLKEAMPFAVSGSVQFIEVKGRKVRGRLYPWGVVEIENPEHSDFVKLRTMLITHMQDLQEVTQEVHYENYRLQKLASEARTGGVGKVELIRDGKGIATTENDEMKRILQEKEAELRNMQRILQEKEAELKKIFKKVSKKTSYYSSNCVMYLANALLVVVRLIY